MGVGCLRVRMLSLGNLLELVVVIWSGPRHTLRNGS